MNLVESHKPLKLIIFLSLFIGFVFQFQNNGELKTPPSALQTGRSLQLSASTTAGGVHFLEHVPSSFITRKESDGFWYCTQDDSILEDPIIIVGTDGSGTRVVAKFMSMLGSTVLVERTVQSQMDVDGQIAGVHFTDPIRHVLELTQSALYEVSSPPLTESVLQEARRLMSGFAKTMRLNACKAGAGGKGKMWAFKKPDLMNLLPFLLEEFPNMQVLHVVRDGRDMAFSKNTSPLKKYGHSLAPSLNKALYEALSIHQNTEETKDITKEALESEKQMAVWAHENQAVTQWGTLNLSRYRWVRIEDFSLSMTQHQSPMPSSQVEAGTSSSMPPFYHALQELVQTRPPPPSTTANSFSWISQFRQPPTFSEYNQVVSELKAKPMGSHDHTSSESPHGKGGKSGEEGLKRKYGKWHSLASKEEIQRLQAIGGTMLQSYGYLPGGRLAEGQARL